MANDGWRPSNVRLHAYETADSDAAHRYIERALPHRRLWMRGGDDGFHFAVQNAVLDGLSAHTVRYSSSVECDADPVSDLVAVRVLSGELALRSSDDDVRVDGSGLALLPVDTAFRATWSGVEAEAVVLPWQSLVEAADAFGHSRPGELRILGHTPATAWMAAHWRSTFRFLHRELFASRSAFDGEAFRKSMTRTAAVTALLTFPNTALDRDRLALTPDSSVPEVLRRAISFMNANVRLPITVPDVAKEAGVSVRTLELAFRRYYGRTPLAHLRGLRLAGAHRELRRADPTTGITVGDIASRWGYQTHSAFSAAYRRQFGRSPRQTLGE